MFVWCSGNFPFLTCNVNSAGIAIRTAFKWATSGWDPCQVINSPIKITCSDLFWKTGIHSTASPLTAHSDIIFGCYLVIVIWLSGFVLSFGYQGMLYIFCSV